MFSFKNKSYELLFREFYAEKQKFADFWVIIILLAQAPLVLHKFGLHSQAIGKISYRAPFIIVHSLAQVMILWLRGVDSRPHQLVQIGRLPIKWPAKMDLASQAYHMNKTCRKCNHQAPGCSSTCNSDAILQ